MDSTATPPTPMVARSAAPATSPRRPRSDGSLVAPEADPDALVEQIRTCLRELRYRRAQLLAKEAAARFPDHPGIGTMNRALNEWRARTRAGNEPSTTEEFNWLRDPPESARGKWVALVGSEPVASAETLAEVMAALEAMTLPRSPLVHYVE